MKTGLNGALMGAVCGDVLGSIYEVTNVREKWPWQRLMTPECRFTDDTVMTCAVAHGLTQGLRQLPQPWQTAPGGTQLLAKCVRDAVAEYGLRYPEAGYGSGFIRWMHSDDRSPYYSWGNGSAMRVSFAGWAADSLAEAEMLAEISAGVTHNHPEGLKGARVVAGCIYLLRAGKGKEAVRAYASEAYDMNFTIDGIRASYRFDVSCQGSVPQAIQAFLEEDCYEDTVSSAISIGGDSDTLAAMAGSLAGVIYPIPEPLREAVVQRLDPFLLATMEDAAAYLRK